MMGFPGFGMMGVYGWVGMLFNLAILIGVVVLIIWAVKRFISNNTSAGSQTPREILQACYVRGELTREQYQQMLQDIS
jgi:putative membrane protein